MSKKTIAHPEFYIFGSTQPRINPYPKLYNHIIMGQVMPFFGPLSQNLCILEEIIQYGFFFEIIISQLDQRGL